MTPHDDTPADLEDRLRTVLRSCADRVEPSADAYRRLALRVAAEGGGARRGGDLTGRPWWRTTRLVALPAVLAVAAVVGALLLTGADQSGQRIDTVSPPTSDAPPTSDVPPTDDGSELGGGTGAGQPADDTEEGAAPGAAGGAGPAFPSDDPAAWYGSPEEAGRVFVDSILGDPGLVLGPVAEGRIPVQGRGEDGTPMRVIGSLTVVEDRRASGDVRYAIAGAEADTIELDVPSPGAAVSDPLRVSGRASAYEGTLHVAVRALDGTLLGSTLAQAGAGFDLEPFEAEVDLFGSGLAFVVVTAPNAAEGGTGWHAAVPVRIGEVPRTDVGTYAVVRVAADDPDGGLVLRREPRADADPVAVLPPASTGVRPLGPRVGVWWQVAARTAEGWVNSRYLALDEPLDDARAGELRRLAEGVARALEDRDASHLAGLPWGGADGDPVLVGWAGRPEAVAAGQLRGPGFWSSVRTWPVPDAFDPPSVQVSFFDYVDAHPGAPEVGAVDDCCTYGVSDRAEVRPLHHVSILSGTDELLDWTVTRLYADWTSGQLRLAAVLVERWEP